MIKACKSYFIFLFTFLTLPTSSKAFVASDPARASKTSFPPGCSSKKLVTSYTYTKCINPYGLCDKLISDCLFKSVERL